MDNYEKKNRIAEALKMRGMKAVELQKRAGVPKSSLSHWIKQRYQPKQKALMAMARALDVSEVWLAGYNVPMEGAAEQKRADELPLLINQPISNQELCDLLKSISTLTHEQFKLVEGMVNELVRSRQQS